MNLLELYTRILELVPESSHNQFRGEMISKRDSLSFAAPELHNTYVRHLHEMLQSYISLDGTPESWRLDVQCLWNKFIQKENNKYRDRVRK